MDITSLSALELGSRIKAGDITSMDAVRAQFEKIKEREDRYSCYITLTQEQALRRAEQVQRRIEAGELRNQPLAGVPMALKDNICTRGVLTSCASKILEGFKPPYDAAVTERLEAAGAVMLGKLNMDEFAMGSTTETSCYGPVKNPWDTGRVPGGSSGGAAAAAAAEETWYAIGSDTGGSIRQPSSFCGVTGMKPTYGAVSRYGLIAYASSLDQIGPIARNVSDCAAVMEIIAGWDKRDSTSVRLDDYKFTDALVDDVKGLRIGIPRSYLGEGLDPEVKEAVIGAAKALEAKGAAVEYFDMGMVDYAIPAYYVIASAEASSNLSRFDGVKYGYRTPDFEDLQEMYKKTRDDGFGMEVKRRMLIGAFVLSSGYYDAYYIKALQVKALIKKGFDEAFEKYDIIIGPTAPTTAPRLGENLSDPLKMYLGDIYTVSVNLAGLPGISVPCGTDSSGLPIGVQMIGQTFSEKTLLRAAYAFEKTMPGMRPPQLDGAAVKGGEQA